MTTESGPAGTADEIAERVLSAALGTMDILAIALGDRLGYYRYLAGNGAVTVSEFAAGTGSEERYAREWLEQQAVTGLLETDGASFRLPPGAAEVLADPECLNYLAPLARQLAAAAVQLPAIADAHRNGGGVPWMNYGEDMRESQADLNRPGFQQFLGSEWLEYLPDIVERLQSAPPARVADVGCGAAWSAIALATQYPLAYVDAFDIDPETVELARKNVTAAGLEERITVHCADIGSVRSGQFDLITAFECLHDMPYPVQVLQDMGRLIAPEGAIMIVDMKVADEFTAPGDDIERLMYGFSILICLVDSMSAEGSAATGTVFRRPVLEDYARQAGFSRVRTLPVRHDMWRFYRLDNPVRGRK